jgi:hypothetical protein
MNVWISRFRPAGSRWRLLTIAFAGVLVGTVLLVVPAASAAGPQKGFGYLWSGGASTAPIGQIIAADPNYQFNSSGAGNTITHTGTGRYIARFANFGPFGTAMVTAYGSDRPDDHCKVLSWTQAPLLPRGPNDPPDTDVAVACFTRTGEPVDTPFTATYADPEPGAVQGAFLWNNEASFPALMRYVPDLTFQYNPIGQSNSIVRTSTGRYRVLLPGLGTNPQGPRQAQVVAYGSAPLLSAYCTLARIDTLGTQAVVFVDCFAPNGSFVDSKFALSYLESGDALFTPTNSRTTVFADIRCTPILHGACFLVRGSPSANVLVSRVQAGEWNVTLNAPLDTGNVQIATNNLGAADRRHCKVAFWNPVTGIRVSCRTGNGAATDDVGFIVSFTV